MPWVLPFGGRGMPAGPPEWPLRGGVLRQPARLADVAEVLAAEWGQVGRKSEAATSKAQR